jgi:pyruvyltransferase
MAYPDAALLYFVPYGANFGDELNVLICKRLVEREGIQIRIVYVNTANEQPPTQVGKRFSFLGSILHHEALSGADVLGTGANPTYNHNVRQGRVLATRGPRTTAFLRTHMGYSGPNPIHGDPALLIPLLFPEWVAEPDQKPDGVGLIPHFNDIPHCRAHADRLASADIEMCFPNQPASKVIAFIRRKKTILSSSLHGLIAAEVLGKEARWLEYPGSKKSEGRFKYLDYYESTGRHHVTPSTRESEALAAQVPASSYDPLPLYRLVRDYLVRAHADGPPARPASPSARRSS